MAVEWGIDFYITVDEQGYGGLVHNNWTASHQTLAAARADCLANPQAALSEIRRFKDDQDVLGVLYARYRNGREVKIR